MTLIGSGKNRIMIFGPKDDGTYVVEFRRVASEALGDLDPQKRSQCDPPFPGADPYGVFVQFLGFDFAPDAARRRKALMPRRRNNIEHYWKKAEMAPEG
jgi:hypothetical protein